MYNSSETPRMRARAPVLDTASQPGSPLPAHSCNTTSSHQKEKVHDEIRGMRKASALAAAGLETLVLHPQAVGRRP
jgi:hypothetical protein